MTPLVVIARELLAAGADRLDPRAEVRSGGLEMEAERLRELVPGASVLVADPTVTVDAGLLEAAGHDLRLVANFAVGYDNIDLDACRRMGVIVTNTPDILTNATAELALTLTLAAARRLSDAERDLRAGRWTGWDPGAYRGVELTGATVGVLGLGRIGTRYAELLSGFGVRLLFTSRSPNPGAERALGARQVDLPELLSASDVVSVHAPATEQTRHLIDEDAIALIGEAGVLVNTSRGSLVDLEAVAGALGSGQLGAAGLDVYEGEPTVPAALLAAPRAVLAPHIGSATVKARDAMARKVAENVNAVLDGAEPPNRVA